MKYSCVLFLGIFLVCNLFLGNTSHSQPLTSGMAVITHHTETGQGPSFQIFEAGNNAYAPLGTQWSTNFYTPSNTANFQQWSNIGSVFGIAIDDEKNIYLSSLPIMYPTAISGPAGNAGIYRVNKDDWSISNFITTGNGVNQIPNTGAGIGNLCFDKYNNQLLSLIHI